MGEGKDTWGEYSKLVLNELEHLNRSYEKMKQDMDTKFNELNHKLSELKNMEKPVSSQFSWFEKVNEVWSPTQMKEAKDEIYKQKSRWVALVAIIGFIQIAVGIGVSIWLKIH